MAHPPALRTECARPFGMGGKTSSVGTRAYLPGLISAAVLCVREEWPLCVGARHIRRNRMLVHVGVVSSVCVLSRLPCSPHGYKAIAAAAGNDCAPLAQALALATLGPFRLKSCEGAPRWCLNQGR